MAADPALWSSARRDGETVGPTDEEKPERRTEAQEKRETEHTKENTRWREGDRARSGHPKSVFPGFASHPKREARFPRKQASRLGPQHHFQKCTNGGSGCTNGGSGSGPEPKVYKSVQMGGLGLGPEPCMCSAAPVSPSRPPSLSSGLRPSGCGKRTQLGPQPTREKIRIPCQPLKLGIA